jgi:large subunit ribosomal protein L25
MKLHVDLRSGEKNSAIRKEGNIPAVVYGKHMDKPLAIMCNKNDFIKKFKEAGYSTPLTLEGKDVDQFVLIQDMQLDPVSDVVLHVDFMAVNKNEKVTTEVPVKLVGESPIEKLGEGKIQLLKDFIEVEAFPQDLPHDVQIDISVIVKMDDTIFVSDIKLSDKVEILDDMEQPIVTVLRLVEEVEEAPVVATPEAGAAAPTE